MKRENGVKNQSKDSRMFRSNLLHKSMITKMVKLYSCNSRNPSAYYSRWTCIMIMILITGDDISSELIFRGRYSFHFQDFGFGNNYEVFPVVKILQRQRYYPHDVLFKDLEMPTLMRYYTTIKTSGGRVDERLSCKSKLFSYRATSAMCIRWYLRKKKQNANISEKYWRFNNNDWQVLKY